METLLNLEAEIVIWLNQGIGRVALLDHLGYLVVSDYFIPLTICFWMLGLWFSGRDVQARDRNQRAVLVAAISLGFVNLTVLILNLHFFRERPLDQYELANLLYEPTDSSFPSNLAAIALPRPWESGWAIAGRGWYCSRWRGCGAWCEVTAACLSPAT